MPRQWRTCSSGVRTGSALLPSSPAVVSRMRPIFASVQSNHVVRIREVAAPPPGDRPLAPPEASPPAPEPVVGGALAPPPVVGPSDVEDPPDSPEVGAPFAGAIGLRDPGRPPWPLCPQHAAAGLALGPRANSVATAATQDSVWTNFMGLLERPQAREKHTPRAFARGRAPSRNRHRPIAKPRLGVDLGAAVDRTGGRQRPSP